MKLIFWVLSFLFIAFPLKAQTIPPTELPNPVTPIPTIPTTPPSLPPETLEPILNQPEEANSGSLATVECSVNTMLESEELGGESGEALVTLNGQTPIITGFEFVGNTVFSQSELEKVTEKFIGSEITLSQLTQVVSQITKLYNDARYINSYALPGGMANGMVKIVIVEGGLETIRITRKINRQRLNPNYICSRLAIAAKPLNLNHLLEALRLLQLNPLIEDISANIVPGSRIEASVLEVNLTEVKTRNIQINTDNSRSPSIGTFRRQITLNEANLLGLGDNLKIGYSNTDGSDSFDFGYTLPINPHNGTVSIAAGKGDSQVVESPFESLDLAGDSRYLDLTIRQPIYQTPRAELALGLVFSRRESHTSILGIDFPLSLGADAEGNTRISALRFFQEWTRRSQKELLAFRSQFSLGIDAFNATINEDIPDSRFFTWRGQAQWVRLLSSDTLLLVSADIQLADNSLLAGEQFALGGFGSVRGYRQDALLTDNGILASVEVRYPIWGKSNEGLGVLQLTPFIDFGSGWNSGGRGNPDAQTLLSVGMGLRWGIRDKATASIYWGIPLLDIDTRDKTLQENGWYFQIESRFFF